MDAEAKDEPIPWEPEGGWDLRREGRAWTWEEWEARSNLGPDKFELTNGRLFWCDEERLVVLCALIENLGIDRVVRLGDPALWREAVAKLDDPA
jgi:hypothetical protein